MSQNVALEKDSLLALALASGQSVSAAAEQLAIDRRTVQRRLADPDFRRMVANFRGEMVAGALGCLTNSMTRAVEAVAALLDAPEPHIRLRAARTILSMATRLRQAVDIDDQIRQLQEEVNQRETTSE